MTSKKKKILIVDDQESVLLIGERIATFAGYEALTADDGNDALEIARKHRVDLVLLDMMLPGKSGFEVLRELKADPNTRKIPVVVITALDKAKDSGLKELSGAARVLTKPVPAKELQETIQELLGPSP